MQAMLKAQADSYLSIKIIFQQLKVGISDRDCPRLTWRPPSKHMCNAICSIAWLYSSKTWVTLSLLPLPHHCTLAQMSHLWLSKSVCINQVIYYYYHQYQYCCFILHFFFILLCSMYILLNLLWNFNKVKS